MTTRNLLHDAGHCLRAATPPLLMLAMLTVTRSVLLTNPTPPVADGLLLPVLGAAFATAAVWLVAAVCWAATRPLRDRRAFQRLQHLRKSAAHPNRALVFVQTVVWGTVAGQHVVVIDLATGTTHRAWLREAMSLVGALVVLESTSGGATVTDWADANEVSAGYRHELRHIGSKAVSPRGSQESSAEDLQSAAVLISEIEAFLDRPA